MKQTLHRDSCFYTIMKYPSFMCAYFLKMLEKINYVHKNLPFYILFTIRNAMLIIINSKSKAIADEYNNIMYQGIDKIFNIENPIIIENNIIAKGKKRFTTSFVSSVTNIFLLTTTLLLNNLPS